MRLDPLLQKQLQWRFQKESRNIIFVTRVKMFINLENNQWQENCSGFLILHQKKYTHGFTIVSVMTFDINFDIQLYTNFPSYAKWIGDQKCLIFLAPAHKNCLKVMFVLESKSEVAELKKQIDKIYNINNGQMEVDFFSQPEVLVILKKVPIDENLLAKDLTLRDGVEREIRSYFTKTESKKEAKKSSGFKYYAIGREEWKMDIEETNFMREKLQAEIIEELSQQQKQARIRNTK